MYTVIILTLLGFCIGSGVPTEIETRNAASALTQFSLDLLKTMYENGKNTFFSGYNVAVGLGMLSLGARGNTLVQIDNALHFDKVNAIDPKAIHNVFKLYTEAYSRPTINYALKSANRLYSHNDFKIEQQFQREIRKYYRGEVEQLDFTRGTAEAIINDWVAKQTNYKIRNLFSPNSLDASSALVLINAIYFKANWDKPFERVLTITDKFFTSKTTGVQVQMMRQIDHFNYHYDSSLRVKVLEFQYMGKDVSMFVLLPDEIDGLPALINSLTAPKLESLMNSMHEEHVQVKLPKFRLETEHSLKHVLAKLGIHDLFTERCNLSAIVHDDAVEKIKVSDILHKTFVQVVEEGTEASAASAIKLSMFSGAKTFVADHPFLFVIRDVWRGVDLFMGVVSDLTDFA